MFNFDFKTGDSHQLMELAVNKESVLKLLKDFSRYVFELLNFPQGKGDFSQLIEEIENAKKFLPAFSFCEMEFLEDRKDKQEAKKYWKFINNLYNAPLNNLRKWTKEFEQEQIKDKAYALQTTISICANYLHSTDGINRDSNQPKSERYRQQEAQLNLIYDLLESYTAFYCPRKLLPSPSFREKWANFSLTDYFTEKQIATICEYHVVLEKLDERDCQLTLVLDNFPLGVGVKKIARKAKRLNEGLAILDDIAKREDEPELDAEENNKQYILSRVLGFVNKVKGRVNELNEKITVKYKLNRNRFVPNLIYSTDPMGYL